MSEEGRGCYCGALDKEYLDKNNIPQGFCGICERCEEPGHTRHFPGPVPYTGSWCDRCYKITGWMYPIRMVVVWFGILAAIYYLVKIIGGLLFS
jgi:hypothetical protein